MPAMRGTEQTEFTGKPETGAACAKQPNRAMSARKKG